jgi:hypothetical protein
MDQDFGRMVLQKKRIAEKVKVSMRESVWFFALAAMISWGVWIPVALTGCSNQGWLWLAGYGPRLAAMVLTALQGGKEGWRGLFNAKELKPDL